MTAVASWPASRAVEALGALAVEARLAGREALGEAPALEWRDGDTLAHWLDAAADALDIDAERMEIRYRDVPRTLEQAAPALLRIEREGEPILIALAGRRGGRLLVVAPDGSAQRCDADVLRRSLCGPLEAPLQGELESLLLATGARGERRERARRALLATRLGDRPVVTCWRLRPSSRERFAGRLRRAGVLRRLAAFLVAHAAQYALWVLAWWLIGDAVLNDDVSTRALAAWALLLVLLVPFRLLADWLEGRIAIEAGALVRQRLLDGALRLAPEEIRGQGAGQLLGRVLDSEAIETMAVTGGLLAVVAAAETLVAVPVLAAGAAPIAQPLLLIGWLGLTVVLARHHLRQRQGWNAARLAMTHDLVERMVGHRTRLAQQAPDRWHVGEAEALADYLRTSHRLDRSLVRMVVLIPRGWVLAALAVLAPPVVAGDIDAEALTVSLGGILLAFGALSTLVAGISHLAGAVIAWRQVAPLALAAARPEALGPPAVGDMTRVLADPPRGAPLLAARDVWFRHAGRAAPVLQRCSLEIRHGERLLLEGASGAGKSTLASLVAGLRSPDEGSLSLAGHKLDEIGSRIWHQRVAASPQFHENHLFLASLAFNLLIGRRWPPGPQELELAGDVCLALGLGPLLDRMPAGLEQIVGETGWQLSHGERSLVYIARSLLSDPQLIVLDESFGALDPATFHRALRCVMNRDAAVLVVAQ